MQDKRDIELMKILAESGYAENIHDFDTCLKCGCKVEPYVLVCEECGKK